MHEQSARHVAQAAGEHRVAGGYVRGHGFLDSDTEKAR